MRAVDERERVLAGRAAGWRKEGLIPAETEAAIVGRMATGGRSYGVFVRAVFFLLTTFALSTFFGFWMIFDIQKFAGLVTAVLGIGVAEYLMQKRWFWTGVEEALWLGGVLALLVFVPWRLMGEEWEALLLILALIFAAAAARLCNPLFWVVAAVLVLVWCEVKLDAGVVAGLGIGGLALALLMREQERPSTEWALAALVVVMPVAAMTVVDPEWLRVSYVLFGAYGLAALLLGLRRPHHALFLGAAAGFLLPARGALNSLFVANEAKLAVAGASLLAVGFVVTRVLRNRTTGLTLAPADFTSFDEELKIAGSMVAAGESAPRSGEQPVSGGGGFGGAGASGEY